MNNFDANLLIPGQLEVVGPEFVAVPLGQRSQPSFKPESSTVMIVDDEQLNIQIAEAYLEEHGFENFVTTTDSREVLELAHKHKPDIVLLDIRMPHVDGLEILTTMREDRELCKIPVVILTSATDSETKLQALRMGVSDFLGKPVDPSELLLRIENVLAAKSLRDHLTEYSERLELQVMIRTSELAQSRAEALSCLARASEYRDDDTGQHVIRVGKYAAILADQLGLPKPAVELIEQAAQLHDIGKMGIPDSVLRKPGKLQPEEYELMKTHCDIGCNILDPQSQQQPVDIKSLNADSEHSVAETTSPILKLASVIAKTHHEKWDGTGYPRGLKGNQIPLEGRIVAVADVFDALASERPYKPAFPFEKCFDIIREGAGLHFDPKVVEAFFARQDDILAIRQSNSN